MTATPEDPSVVPIPQGEPTGDDRGDDRPAQRSKARKDEEEERRSGAAETEGVPGRPYDIGNPDKPSS